MAAAFLGGAHVGMHGIRLTGVQRASGSSCLERVASEVVVEQLWWSWAQHFANEVVAERRVSAGAVVQGAPFVGHVHVAAAVSGSQLAQVSVAGALLCARRAAVERLPGLSSDVHLRSLVVIRGPGLSARRPRRIHRLPNCHSAWSLTCIHGLPRRVAVRTGVQPILCLHCAQLGPASGGPVVPGSGAAKCVHLLVPRHRALLPHWIFDGRKAAVRGPLRRRVPGQDRSRSMPCMCQDVVKGHRPPEPKRRRVGKCPHCAMAPCQA
mmetsp:Transcript_48096/g.120491  ORF Transcript_48096/g.120491 Transcript_48096/m.120491 type:complete len:266 (+) Transcript_48096:1301-2098(+)